MNQMKKHVKEEEVFFTMFIIVFKDFLKKTISPKDS